MGIRQEFKKAFTAEYEGNLAYDQAEYYRSDLERIALWAANWMAERCAIEIDSMNHPLDLPSTGGNKIRQLTKDLDAPQT